MLIEQKTKLKKDLVRANLLRKELKKISIVNSCSDVDTLYDLCSEFAYTVRNENCEYRNSSKLINEKIVIIISSDFSNQDRILIVDAEEINFDDVKFCLNYMLAISQRKLFGASDIRRSILFAETKDFFIKPENIYNWIEIISEYGSIANAFDITFGQIHIDQSEISLANSLAKRSTTL